MKLKLTTVLAFENPLYNANGKVMMMELELGEIEKFFKR